MTQEEISGISQDENNLIAERRSKLTALRQTGNAFPNDYRRDNLARILHEKYDSCSREELESSQVTVKVAGRMLFKRVMGKASFATIQDMSGRIQLYISNDHTGETAHEAFRHYDLGDILGAEGVLFKTRTDELSLRVTQLHLLTKSLRPLPEKFHGLADQEQKYRRRYLDLITNLGFYVFRIGQPAGLFVTGVMTCNPAGKRDGCRPQRVIRRGNQYFITIFQQRLRGQHDQFRYAIPDINVIHLHVGDIFFLRVVHDGFAGSKQPFGIAITGCSRKIADDILQNLVRRLEPEGSRIADVELDNTLAFILHLSGAIENRAAYVVADIIEFAGFLDGLHGGHEMFDTKKHTMLR